MAVLMVSKSRKNKYGVFYSSKKRTKIIILSANVVKKVPSKSMLANTSTPLQNANNYLGLLSVFSYGTLLYGKICLMIVGQIFEILLEFGPN